MGLFDEVAERDDAVRRYLFHVDAPPPRRRQPDRYDGFVPLSDAAEMMGVGEDELVWMVRRDELDGRLFDGKLRVRPAIVTKTLVNHVERAAR